MRGHGWMALLLAVLVVVGCARTPKAVPLVPLSLDNRAPAQAVSLTAEGASAYQSGQFPEAKVFFEQAVTMAPEVGAAHYNLALALNALGDAQAAHDRFIEAATLEPGNKVIWDSPALRPYGNPEGTKASAVPMNSGRRGAMGGYGSSAGGIGSPR